MNVLDVLIVLVIVGASAYGYARGIVILVAGALGLVAGLVVGFVLVAVAASLGLGLGRDDRERHDGAPSSRTNAVPRASHARQQTSPRSTRGHSPDSEDPGVTDGRVIAARVVSRE